MSDNRSELCRQTPIYLHSDQTNNEGLSIPKQADTDVQIIALWLHGRSKQTQRVYGSDIKQFLGNVQKPFAVVTLGNLHSFADYLEERGLQSTTRHRILSDRLGLDFVLLEPVPIHKLDVPRNGECLTRVGGHNRRRRLGLVVDRRHPTEVTGRS